MSAFWERTKKKTWKKQRKETKIGHWKRKADEYRQKHFVELVAR
jgi:hypothetical protein